MSDKDVLYIKREHKPVINERKETIINADHINFFWLFLPFIKAIDGILIGTPDIIPAARGLR